MSILGLISNSLAVQAVGILVATWIIILCTTRVFFHPLSKWPGPWLNKISTVPEALSMIGGRQHAYHRMLHKKYGPVVRIGPTELAFCSAKAWDDIYGAKPGKQDMAKSPLAAGGLPQGLKAMPMTLADWDNHTRQRKAFAHPFSNTALLQQEPLIQGWVDKLVATLGSFADEDKPANMAAWFTYITFDIVGDLVFDEPFGCLDSGNGSEWSKNIVNVASAAAFEQATRRIAGRDTWLQKLMARFLVPESARVWRMKHFALSAEKVKRRIADKDKEHKDFIYYILKNDEAKSLLSEMEIIMNSALFIAAGSDTTATALAAWMYLILTNKQAYGCLTAEIRGAFKSHTDITWTSLRDLEYLGAVVNETLRCFPPVPGNFNRITPPEGAYIDGRFIAGNTTVSNSFWASSHSPDNFTDPDAFAPERWLEAHRAEYPRHLKEGSQPFLTGPRGCVGKNLSYIEQRLIIAHVLWHFDFELVPDAASNKLWSTEGDFKHLKSYTVWKKPDLWAKVKRVVR